MQRLSSAVLAISIQLTTGCASTMGKLAVTEPDLVLGAVKPLPVASMSCPGKGSPGCEINWRAVQVGDHLSAVTSFLQGGHSQTRIYVDRVVSHSSFNNGGLLTFQDDVLINIKMPGNFAFPGKVKLSPLAKPSA